LSIIHEQMIKQCFIMVVQDAVEIFSMLLQG
jgi:hypothetical protein